uniref:Secreted protein n=1 Tax=Lutzomyia longipalpis TaxID=7200 RepID=A0A1B0C8V6_LUTLO
MNKTLLILLSFVAICEVLGVEPSPSDVVEEPFTSSLESPELLPSNEASSSEEEEELMPEFHLLVDKNYYKYTIVEEDSSQDVEGSGQSAEGAEESAQRASAGSKENSTDVKPK